MQGIPTTTIPSIKPFEQHHQQPAIGHPPPLFRPYNHYSYLNVPPLTTNGLGIQDDGPYKSAFKPVTRQPVQPVNSDNASAKPVKLYAGEPMYFNTPNVTITSFMNSNAYNYGQMPLPYEPHLYRDFGGITSLEAKRDEQNVDTTTKNVDISCNVTIQQPNPSQQIIIDEISPKPAAECDKTQTAHIEKSNNGKRIYLFYNNRNVYMTHIQT